jgi:hypothetical protein
VRTEAVAHFVVCRCRCLWLCAPAALLLGCGGRPGLMPVSGTVRLDGQPLEKLSVTFFPAQGRAANGVTHPDGRFVLTTFKQGDGALIGEHTVTIVPMLDPPIALPSNMVKTAKQVAAKAPPIPEKFQDNRTTDLKRTVKPDGGNEFTFDLSSK